VLAELPPSLPALAGRALVWIERRRMPIAGVAALLVAIAIVIALAARFSGDVALFDAPLHPSQTREVASALTLWGEKHSADPAGTQLFVAASRRSDVLLRLTLAGLPRPYVPTSADVLAEPASPLAPAALLDDRRRIGTQGDLTATLRRISGVSDASVILTPPSDDPFAANATSPPSAAVQLVLQPAARPAPSAVDGIRRLVAAAVAGLTPDRVTVTDSEGNVLDGAPPQDKTATREARVQSSVQTALDAVLGQGASVVRVRVVIAGVQVSLQATRVTPHGLLDADVGREHGNEATRAFDKERHVQHYAYDTEVERRSTPADAVRRISVAVFLDGRRVDATRRDDVAALVRAAAGADLSAGDAVVVGVLPFAASSPEPHVSDAATAPPTSMRTIVPLAAACVIALAGLFWPRRNPSSAREEPFDAADGAVVIAAIGAESPRTAAHMLTGVPAGMRARVLRELDPARRGQIQACLVEWNDD
jgi:flagellar M-ring protein FliF